MAETPVHFEAVERLPVLGEKTPYTLLVCLLCLKRTSTPRHLLKMGLSVFFVRWDETVEGPIGIEKHDMSYRLIRCR